jgi:hypothetical protein
VAPGWRSAAIYANVMMSRNCDGGAARALHGRASGRGDAAPHAGGLAGRSDVADWHVRSRRIISLHMPHSNTCTSGRPLRSGKDSNKCIAAPQRGHPSRALSATDVMASLQNETGDTKPEDSPHNQPYYECKGSCITSSILQMFVADLGKDKALPPQAMRATETTKPIKHAESVAESGAVRRREPPPQQTAVGSARRRGRPSGQGGATARPQRPSSLYFTFFTTHSSTTRAMSRLFFSIITMWPLPWMPLSCRRTYSALTPA